MTDAAAQRYNTVAVLLHWIMAAAFFLMLLVDNVCARVKWQFALRSAWRVTLVLGCGNILVLWLLELFGILKLNQ